MINRLAKVLAAAGVDSRRHCEILISEGRVSVNGETIYIPQTMVDSTKDHILVDGKKIKKEEKKYYFLLNKPQGYHCTAAPTNGKMKRVLDFFSHIPSRLFTVGRLDRDTTGLILVSNDGHFANQVIHPSFGLSKEYLAKTSQEITFEHLKKLSDGTLIERKLVRPLAVKKVRKGTVKITVGEGKKHEVRLLLAAAGLTVRDLCRIRVGSLTLGTLQIGEWRELSKNEIDSLLNIKGEE